MDMEEVKEVREEVAGVKQEGSSNADDIGTWDFCDCKQQNSLVNDDDEKYES